MREAHADDGQEHTTKREQVKMAGKITETMAPGSYDIEELLTRSAQPFPDLPAAEMDALTESIRTQGLLTQVRLTKDGLLWDGHQRCKALLAAGRKRLMAKDVIVDSDITRDNAVEKAITSNTVRRMITAEDKAGRMHKLTAMGWSQRRIGRAFGISQPAVSQLLDAYPPADSSPDIIVTQGEDGKRYTRPRKDTGGSIKYPAWSNPKGSANKMLQRVKSEMITLSRAPMTGIGDNERQGISWTAKEIADLARQVWERAESQLGQPL